MKNEFKVIEYASGFAVLHVPSGHEHWMSDGIDALFTPGGKAMSPGSEHFRRTWERSLNATASETREAYFSDLAE